MKKLQSAAGGTLLKIDTAVPYSGSYNDVVVHDGARRQDISA